MTNSYEKCNDSGKNLTKFNLIGQKCTTIVDFAYELGIYSF